MELNTDVVRDQYDVYRNPKTARWAFFENAGGSYVPRQVVNRLDRFFRYHKVQPYGLFTPSHLAGVEMDSAYRIMAELLGADEEEITFGPSTTMNTYVLSQAFRSALDPGDEIIVTNQDHEANIGCWRRLESSDMVIKEWRIDPVTGELAIADLENLVTRKTRLICFTLCSNIVGTMNDFSAITRIAKDAGALTIADGVSFAPHRLVDVKALGVDIYLFSTYKTFGTHLGVMWGKKEVLEKLPCQGHYFNDSQPHYRMNPAGPLHAEIAALTGIGEYLETLHSLHFNDSYRPLDEIAKVMFDMFASHETRLANRVLEALGSLPKSRIIGQTRAEAGSRAATISFVPPAGRLPSDVVKDLADREIAARNGHFYALRCLEALGIENTDEGVVRLSLVHYNSDEEVDRLVKALGEVLG